MQRTRMLLIVAGLLAASQVPALASGAVAFTSGLASGDVTDTGAILWTRVDQAASVVAEVALDPGFQQLIDAVPVMAGPETDFTVKVDLDSLQPESRYFYRFVQGVVYLHPADNGAGPVASYPLEVNQPVVSSQLRALG